MRLSAEQFAELAASFEGYAETETEERRRAPRLELQTRIRITPTEFGDRLPPVDVTVCDFSARGIAFLQPTPMQPGQQFVTTLPRKHGGSVELLCTVAHCTQVSNQLHRIGAEFTCTLSPASPQPSEADVQEMARIRKSMLG